MADYIEAQFDVAVKPSTIGKKLKKARWSNKRIHHEAFQQSMPLRQDWIRKVSQFTADMYVFCDENCTDRRDGAQRTGWSPKGVSPVLVSDAKIQCGFGIRECTF